MPEKSLASFVAPSPTVPSSVLAAARLILVGAVIAVLNVIVLIADRSGLSDAIRDENVGKTAAEINSMVDSTLIRSTLIGLLFAAIYVFLAIQVGKDRRWARIVALVHAPVGVVIAASVNSLTLPVSSKVMMVLAGVVDLLVFVALVRRTGDRKVGSDGPIERAVPPRW